VPARDPRFRPYRVALWVLYFGVIALLVTLFVTSIARDLRGRPRRAAPAGALPTRTALRVCFTDLEALYREQNQRAWALGAGFEGPDPLAQWAYWAPRWEEQVEDLSDRCRLDVTAPKEEFLEERTEMAAARDAMLALHRAYTAHVNRFAQEDGDLARAAAEAMAHARESVERWRRRRLRGRRRRSRARGRRPSGRPGSRSRAASAGW
jgi:hypothetical protein